MAQIIYGMDQEDVAIIKSLIERAKKTGWRPPVQEEFVESYSPDVYIALVPVAGIPALEVGPPDAPGHATCNIYKIIPGTGTGTDDPDYELEAISGLSKEVFNLSTEKIDSRYVPVMRSKFGFWLAVPPAETTGTSSTGTGTGSTGTGSTGTSTATSTATSTSTAGTATSSSSAPCYDNLTEDTSPAYILGIDSNGCMVKVPVTTCP